MWPSKNTPCSLCRQKGHRPSLAEWARAQCPPMPVWFSLWFSVSASPSPLSATRFLGWVTESPRKGGLSLPSSIQPLSLCLPCPPQAVGMWEADANHARAPTPVGLGDSGAASHAEWASTGQVSRHQCDATQHPGRAPGCPPLSMTHTDHPKDVEERPKPLSFAQSCGPWQDSRRTGHGATGFAMLG